MRYVGLAVRWGIALVVCGQAFSAVPASPPVTLTETLFAGLLGFGVVLASALMGVDTFLAFSPVSEGGF